MLFFIVTMVSNGLNYLFQITMGRMLTVEKYGEMNSLFSIIMLLSILFAPMTSFFAHYTARLYALNENGKIHDLFRCAYKRFGLVAVLFIMIISFFSPSIGSYIHVNTLKVLLVLLSIVISLVVIINNGFIQGLHNFKLLSITIVLSSLLKYIFTFIFVYKNRTVYGVLYGLFLSSIIVGLYSYYIIKKQYINKWQVEEFPIERGKITNYLLPMTLSNFLFGALTQIDVIMVKHFFLPYEAGIYSSAAIMGKAVMYLPGAIVLSLFPIVSAEDAKDKDTLHILFKAIMINVFLAGTGVLLLLLFPRFIVNLLFGSKYLLAIDIVGYFSAAMFCMGFISILMNYFLALGEVRFVFGLFGSLVFEIAGFYLYHQSLKQILFIILLSGILSLTVFSMFVFLEYKKMQYKV
jgi:O-antigen/teichoic acid export membrane protein